MNNKYFLPIACVIAGLLIGGFGIKLYITRQAIPRNPNATLTPANNWDLQAWLNKAKDKDGVVDLDKLADPSIFKDVKVCRDPDNKFEVIYPEIIPGYSDKPSNSITTIQCIPTKQALYGGSIEDKIRIFYLTIEYIDSKQFQYEYNRLTSTSGFYQNLNQPINKFKTNYLEGTWKPVVLDKESGPLDNDQAIVELEPGKLLHFYSDYSLGYQFAQQPSDLSNELKWKIFVTLIANTKPLR